MSSTRFRLYIHSAGPAFRSKTMQEVRILLMGASPRSKVPQIKEMGSTGLVVTATLRDLYVLAHGLKTADDILVQLIKPQPRVGSLNKLIQSLQSIPIHAFAPRVVPFRSSRVHGKLTNAELKEEEALRQEAESHLLHNNIRVLIDKSILCNRDLVRKFASETFRSMLLLKRGQALKRKNVKYTDNPALFGKSEQEGEEILRLMAAQDGVDAIGESTTLLDEDHEQLYDLDGMDVDPDDFNNSSVLFDDIVDENGEVDALKLRSILAQMKKGNGASKSAKEGVEASDDELDLDEDALDMIKTHVKEARQGKDVETLTMQLELQGKNGEVADEIDDDDDMDFEEQQYVVKDSLQGQGQSKTSTSTSTSTRTGSVGDGQGSTTGQHAALASSPTSTTAIATSENSSELEELETALQHIANNNLVPAAMSPSLLVPAMLHMGATTSTSSTKVISNALDSAPTIQSFLPPELAKLKDNKIYRKAKSNPEIRKMVERAEEKVAEMTARLKLKDKKVNAIVKSFKESAPAPTMYIPHRPSDDLSSNAVTLQLDRNRLTLSLSAIGQQHQALFKRGWRTHIIETSMRETVAAGCLAIAYEMMSPLEPTSPLTRLEEKDFTEPIRETFTLLAANAKIGRDSKAKLPAVERKAQAHMLTTMEKTMGAEQAQKALLGALVDEHKDILSRQDVLDQMKDQSEPKSKKTAGDITIAGVGIEQLHNAVGGPIDDITCDIGAVPLTSTQQSITSGDIPVSMSSSDVGLSTIKSKNTSDISNLTKPNSAAIIDAITQLPIYHQAQAAASLAAGIPFDPIAPIPSPTLVPLSKHGAHARDSTQLSEVLAYTLNASITDADPAVRIFDPFCGSGTLVIESVFKFMGLPTPPLPRPFAFENWPIHNEYEYNALMREWNLKYDEMVQKYIDKFGVSKANSLFGAGYENEDMNLDNFPLFIGSDLRDKSIRAAVHNAKSARVNYFTQFYKTDFEKIMNQAGRKWEEYVQSQVRASTPTAKPGSFSSKAANFSSSTAESSYFAGPGNNGLLKDSHPALLDPITKPVEDAGDIYDGPIIPTGIMTPDDILGMMNFEPKQPQNDRGNTRRDYLATRNQPKHNEVTQFSQANELPLRFPYLKGYTMFSNIPWGVSDMKPRMSGSDRYNRDDRYARGHVNTTQQEPVEDLYQRLGASLYRHGHLFRDVFILSAHVKFQKLTAIGAQRAYFADERKHNKTSKAVMISNNIARISNPGDLQWEVVTSFYNQGVRTDLLKLKK